jgi:hypothetical protein
MSCSPQNLNITDSDLVNPRFPDLRSGPIRRGPVSRFPVSRFKRETGNPFQTGNGKPGRRILESFRRTGLVGTRAGAPD